MLSRPSNNFKISDTTKNLFLFFQCVNEMTFDYSPDTYKAPTLNTRLICREAYNTYKFWLNHKFCGISDSSRSSVGSYRIASERNIRHQDIRIPVCEES